MNAVPSFAPVWRLAVACVLAATLTVGAISEGGAHVAPRPTFTGQRP